MNQRAEYEWELLTIRVQGLLDHVRDFVETTEGLLQKYSSDELNTAQVQLVERLRTTDRDLTEEDETVEWHLLYQEHEWRFDSGITRSLRYASVMLLYTVVEDILRTIVCEDGGQFSEKETHAKGIERYRLFLARVRSIALGSLDGWTTITNLQKVRNCIAHAGGEIEPCRNRAQLRALAEHPGSGIQIGRYWADVIDVQPEFLTEAVAAVARFFDGLLKPLGNEAPTLSEGGVP